MPFRDLLTTAKVTEAGSRSQQDMGSFRRRSAIGCAWRSKVKESWPNGLKGKIPKTPIIGPVYAAVIDRCGNKY